MIPRGSLNREIKKKTIPRGSLNHGTKKKCIPRGSLNREDKRITPPDFLGREAKKRIIPPDSLNREARKRTIPQGSFDREDKTTVKNTSRRQSSLETRTKERLGGLTKINPRQMANTASDCDNMECHLKPMLTTLSNGSKP
jgi:hypothetical protein